MVYDVFDDRKTQAGSALFAAPAFVHPVEAFKDSFLGFFGDAYAIVLYHEDDFFPCFVYIYPYITAGSVILDGISEKV